MGNSTGQAPFRKVLTKTKNVYVPCHDCWDKNNATITANAYTTQAQGATNAGVLDDMVLYYDLVDGNGTQYEQMTLENTNDNVQWGGATPDGRWKGQVTNSTDCAYLVATTGNLSIFTDILYGKGEAVLFAWRFRLDETSVAATPGRAFKLLENNAAVESIWEHKMLTGLVQNVVFNGTSDPAVQSDAMSQNDDIICFAYINDAAATNTVQFFSYTPGTTAVVETGTPDSTTTGVDAPTATNAVFMVGAGCTGANMPTDIATYQNGCSVSDIRVINFGTTEPASGTVTRLMEDLAKNSLHGTTLDL